MNGFSLHIEPPSYYHSISKKCIKGDSMSLSTDGLFIAIGRLLLFNVSVLKNEYRVLIQNPFFSSDVL